MCDAELDGYTPEWYIQHGIDIGYERAYTADFKDAARLIASMAVPLWHFGDGEGGMCKEWLDDAFEAAGLLVRSRIPTKPPTPSVRKPISKSLRTAVMERDEYRCRHCGTHLDLTIDHVVPVSKGGASNLDNLQTLCMSCNAKKGVRPDPVHEATAP